MSSIIIPAILEKTPQGFAEKFEKIKQLPVERIQVDFCDGEFVENSTLKIDELPKLDPKFHWEAHLMISRPTDFASYAEAGFKTVIVHYEAFGAEAHLEGALLAIDNLGMEPVIAINPESAVSVLRYDTDTIHRFIIMGIHPGEQGREFMPETVARISELRSMAPNAKIEIDGGVKAENAKSIIGAGATDIVVGSALFETEDIKQNYEKIVDAIK